MNPFANILDDAALEVLTATGAGFPATRYYLAGGTALALQIGHRRSLDLDFFQGDQVYNIPRIVSRGLIGSKDKQLVAI